MPRALALELNLRLSVYRQLRHLANGCHAITTESMLVNTFCFMLGWSTAVITTRFLTLTTKAMSSSRMRLSLAPFCCALSTAWLILATSSSPSWMSRCDSRYWA